MAVIRTVLPTEVDLSGGTTIATYTTAADNIDLTYDLSDFALVLFNVATSGGLQGKVYCPVGGDIVMGWRESGGTARNATASVTTSTITWKSGGGSGGNYKLTSIVGYKLG